MGQVVMLRAMGHFLLEILKANIVTLQGMATANQSVVTGPPTLKAMSVGSDHRAYSQTVEEALAKIQSSMA